ncbi:MAG: (2Fe-2S)-binding protein [Acidimicrobiia bacterium]|nr:(2Fe-2S)-binding protein [Acidimicrobiia bacterium]MYJ15279.1 (2Fe-2S)-binding protein [Acidimicrobiia bacterium]
MAQVAITLNVNGRNQTTLAEPREILADVLRDRLGLTGTHLGCEHGVCGACTVLLDGEMVRSCLLFAVQAQGAEITTVEGLEENGELHPMQKAFSEYHGLQCGFCTPGMILAGIDLLKRNPDPTAEEVRDDMGGNVCRCTGYQKIVESVLGAAREMNEVTS